MQKLGRKPFFFQFGNFIVRQVLQWTKAACTDLLLKIHRVLKHPFKECIEWLCFMSLLHFWLPFTLINFELNWGWWQKPIAIKNSAVVFVLKNMSHEGSNVHGNRLVFLSVSVCEALISLLNTSCSRWFCSGSAWARRWARGEALRCQLFCNSAGFPWSVEAAKTQSLGRSLCSWDVEAGFLSEAVWVSSRQA